MENSMTRIYLGTIIITFMLTSLALSSSAALVPFPAPETWADVESDYEGEIRTHFTAED